MKIKIDTNQILKKFAAYKKVYIGLVVCTFICLIGYSLYSVLSVKINQSVASQYNKKSQEINLSFDKKFLQDLATKKSPTKVEQTGGRNPFLSF